MWLHFQSRSWYFEKWEMSKWFTHTHGLVYMCWKAYRGTQKTRDIQRKKECECDEREMEIITWSDYNEIFTIYTRNWLDLYLLVHSYFNVCHNTSDTHTFASFHGEFIKYLILWCKYTAVYSQHNITSQI